MDATQSWSDKLPALFSNSDSKSIEDGNTGIPKYPLLFVDEQIYRKWCGIQDNWVNGLLPDAFGQYSTFVAGVDEDDNNDGDGGIGSSKKERLKQKRYQVRALKQTDLMPLYSMRDIDITKVTELVLQKKVSVKSTKSTKKQPVLPGLNEACHLEKKRRLIKNEFMHYFEKKELRCKTMRADSYTDAEYDTAALKYNVTEATIDTWYEKLSKDVNGERFFRLRSSALCPSNKESDFPTLLGMLFEYQRKDKGDRVRDVPATSGPSVASMYKCLRMSRKNGDLATVLDSKNGEIVSWMKANARITIVFCFLNRLEKGTPDFSIMDQVLRSLRAMEIHDQAQFRRANYSGVFITDRAGLVDVANAIEERGSRVNQIRPWLHTPTLYITQGKEGFITPTTPEPTLPLYFNFVYGNDFDQRTPDSICFQQAYGTDMPFYQVVSAADFKDPPTQWAQDGYANFNIDAVTHILGTLGAPNNILVNIGGGPSITWIGLVRGS